MSFDWSCWQMQSLVSWKCTACCKTIIFSISWVWARWNLHLVMRLQMHWDSACIPLLGCCLTSESSSSLCALKCPLDLIVVLMASRVTWGVLILSSVMVPLSGLLRSGEPPYHHCQTWTASNPCSTHQPAQSQCPRHPGSQGSWYRRLSSPHTG